MAHPYDEYMCYVNTWFVTSFKYLSVKEYNTP